MTKFHIKFECNKEVLADLIAMGLTKDAVVIEMKRAESVPVKQYSFDELKPKVRETQTIAAMPVPKRTVTPYTQQTTGWDVYKAIEENFSRNKPFTSKEVLTICRWINPDITYGPITGHISRMRKIGLIRLREPFFKKHQKSNEYVIVKLVSKEKFAELLTELRVD